MTAQSRAFLAIFAVAMLLTGCRSSKRASSPQDKYGSATEQRYSWEAVPDETDAMGDALVTEARRWIGTPYRYGGSDMSGTDCSGMVMEIFRSVCATKIPRTTAQQLSYCTKVARNKARVGDLMFFGPSNNPSAVSHVGLYIGKGEMIHASSSRGVTVSKVDAGYWGERFCGAGRVGGAYDSWASISGLRKKKSKSGKRGGDPAPVELPDDGHLPVPVMEVAYDKLPVAGNHLPLESAPSAPQATTASSAPQTMAASSSSVVSSVTEVASPSASIDLLDLIINQKVDSIFSERFMD